MSTKSDFHEQCVSSLLSLGFDREPAEIALTRTDYDVDAAAELLLSGGKTVVYYNCRLLIILTVFFLLQFRLFFCFPSIKKVSTATTMSLT